MGQGTSGDPNPYAALPVMNIYTYDLGRLLKEFADEDVAFNFREFFRVNEDGGFVHERDVPAFLNLLTKETRIAVILLPTRNTGVSSGIRCGCFRG